MTEKQQSILKQLPELMVEFHDIFPVANALLNSYEKDGTRKISNGWIKFVLEKYSGLEEAYANKGKFLEHVLQFHDPITHELIAGMHYTHVMATLNSYLAITIISEYQVRLDALKERVAEICGHDLKK